MAIALSDGQARSLRLRAQRLAPPQPGDSIGGVAGVVQALCGLQAQDAPAAALGARVRSAGLVAADVERARVEERSVVRTWGPRGTLHLLATADLGWLLSLFGPLFIKGNQRRYAQLGLDEETLKRGVHIIRETLASQGPLTRDELAERLAGQGIPTAGQAKAYLMFHAALLGVICLGPDRGSKPTYALLSDWAEIGQALPPAVAEAELARRYLQAYGPATPADLAAWSGLPMNQLRPAWQRIADQLIEVQVAGAPAWMLKTQAGWLDEAPAYAPMVHLLPAFDTYLLGYQQRDLAVAPQYAKRINAGGGIVHPALLVNGRAVGVWKLQRGKRRLDVIVEPFERLLPDVQPGLEAEAADIARFLEIPATLHILALG